MSRGRWTRISAMILVAGWVAFTLKLIAIPTTGGDDFESGVVALLFFAGMFGMLVGSTALGSLMIGFGLWSLRREPRTFDEVKILS